MTGRTQSLFEQCIITSVRPHRTGPDRLQEPDGACVRVLTYERMDALFFRTTNVSPPPDSKNTKARRSATIPVPHKQPTSWLLLVQYWAAYQIQRKKSTLLAALSHRPVFSFLIYRRRTQTPNTFFNQIYDCFARASHRDQIVSSLRPNCCWNTDRPRKSRNSSVLSSDGRCVKRAGTYSVNAPPNIHQEVVPTKAGPTLYMHHDRAKQSVKPYGVRALNNHIVHAGSTKQLIASVVSAPITACYNTECFNRNNSVRQYLAANSGFNQHPKC
ncbi:hypothetical protein niasHT_006633 [Heterodera trifolii]|uniref:Uncharacterized protein n=1 Tax=Heterodera trifolii TaxID=157864 RepID=A0ABD2K277_9BILA